MATETFRIVIEAAGLQGITQQFDKLNKTVSTSRQILGFFRNALVTIATIEAASGITDLIDSYTNLQNRVKLVTNTSQELAAVQQELFRISQETRTGVAENAQLFYKFASSTGALKLNFQQLLGVVQTTDQAIKVSGATTAEAKNSLVQFGQALASGTLRGDELRSVVEQFPRLATAIGQEFGVAGGALANFAKQNPGIVTTDRIIKAINESAPQIAKEFQDITPTIGDAFTRLNNALILFLGGVSQSIGVGRTFNTVADVIIQNLDKIAIGLLVIGSITAFNIITSQVLKFGQTLLSVVGIFVGPLSRIGTLIAAPFTILATVGRLAAAPIFLLISLFQNFGAVLTTVRTAAVAFLTTGLLPFVVGVAIVGALTAAFFLFKDQILSVLPTMAQLRQAFNTVAAYGVATVKTIIDNFKLLPAAVADIFIQLVNAGLKQLNKLSEGFLNIFRDKDKKVDLSTLQFTGIENPVAGAAEKIGKSFQENLDANLKVDFASKIEEGAKGVGDFFKSFTIDAKLFDPAQLDGILKGLPKVAGALNNTGDATDQLKGRLRTLLSSISPLIQEELKLKDAQDAVAKGSKYIAEAGLSNEEVLKRVERQVVGVGNASSDAAEKIILLNKAFRDGSITAEEFRVSVRKAQIEGLQGNQDLLSGIQRGSLAAANAIEDRAAIGERAIQDLSGKALEATSFYTTAASQAHVALFDQIDQLRQQDVISELEAQQLKANAQQQFLDTFVQKGQEVSAQYKALFEDDNITRAALGGAGAIGAAFTDLATNLQTGVAQVQAARQQIDQLEAQGVITHQTAEQRKAAIDKQYQSLRLASSAQFFGGLASLASSSNSTIASIGKAAAIAQATINTYSSAVAAYNAMAGIPYVGPVLGAIAAAAAIAAGIANIAQIRATNTSGFATGGQFTVGGNGGIDSQLVQFRATPGELVDIKTRGQVDAAANAARDNANDPKAVLVNLNITGVTDVDSFRRSEAQISGELAQAITIAQRRNT